MSLVHNFKGRYLLPHILGVLVVVLMALGLFTSRSEAEKNEVAAKFNQKGELIRPENYRDWIFVGAPVTPNDMNNGKAPFPEFHYVYIDPVSYKEYKATDNFRDGTILVKELDSVGGKQAASGNGYFAGNYIGLEATVNDSKRFKNEPGAWAYFSFSQADHKLPYKDTASAFPKEACNACHQSNAADDWVFTQYYPVLRDGKV